MRIPLARPYFDHADEDAVLEALRSGWVGQGPRVLTFETALAAFVGAPHAAAVSSCTAALHLAVLALGLGPGDEVLVPALTWISTPHAVEYSGAVPVFCDIDDSTYNVDPEEVARRVTARTRAIVPVHLFGLVAPMDSICDVARRRDLGVVEDAACALGGELDGRHAGTFGDVGCFSFHPRKSITTGEGGMLTTARSELDRSFRSLRDIGADRSGSTAGREDSLPDFPTLGFNYRMTDLQASLGLSQLRKFGEILRRRRDVAARYDSLIRQSHLTDWLQAPSAVPGHAYQAYVCRVTPPDNGTTTLEAWHHRRNRLMQLLADEGVGTRPGTHAPHLLAYYRRKYGFKPGDFPHAWRADWLTLALPFYPQISADEQAEVCSLLDRLWPRTL